MTKPTLAAQIKSLTSTAINTIKSGKIVAGKTETEKRRETCMGSATNDKCEFMVTNWKNAQGVVVQNDLFIDWPKHVDKFEAINAKLLEEAAPIPRCAKCGCGIANKTKVFGSTCPAGKW